MLLREPTLLELGFPAILVNACAFWHTLIPWRKPLFKLGSGCHIFGFSDAQLFGFVVDGTYAALIIQQLFNCFFRERWISLSKYHQLVWLPWGSIAYLSHIHPLVIVADSTQVD